MTPNELTGSAITAYLVAEILEMLKRSTWFPWITHQTAVLNRVAGIVIAGVSALGVHVVFSADAGTLTITGLTASGILATLGNWLKQWAMQQFAYRSAVKS